MDISSILQTIQASENLLNRVLDVIYKLPEQENVELNNELYSLEIDIEKFIK